MIQDSFKNMNQYIADEISRIENIADLFSNIEKEIDRIASISEGHAAAVEELSAKIKEHTASI
jgi:methyl-accepting chemotaxis protein